MCDAGRRTFHDNATEARLQASLTREGGRFVDLDAKAAARRAARSLAAANTVGVVASASLSLEEGFLLAEIVAQSGGGPLIVTSPAEFDIADDGFLISSDRFPNRRGLLGLGFVERSAFEQNVDGIVVARANPAGGDETWTARLEKASATVVVDDRISDSAAFADHVLAVASHFEAPGAFMNRDGRVQRFDKAIDPPGRAVAGWEALAELLAELGGTRFASQEDILSAALDKLAGRPLADGAGALSPYGAIVAR